MGLFSFLFGGKYPSTNKYEAEMQSHKAEFEKYKAFSDSAKLVRLKELRSITSEEDFKKRVKQLKEEKFNSTEAYRKMMEHKALSKSADIVMFKKFVGKSLDKRLESALVSPEYTRYMELEKVVKSPDFIAKMRDKKTFKNSPDFGTYKEHHSLAKSGTVKFIRKTMASPAYKNYTEVIGSERLKRYEELTPYVNSNEFIAYKAELEDKDRFKKSKECALLNELASLEKDKEVVWYFKKTDAKAFADLQSLKMTFEENFEGTSLDKNKWVFGYYWGNVLAGGTYSLETERQAFVPSNAVVCNSALTIVTTKEPVKGKMWNSQIGFVDADFEYKSALVNTGNSFRQKFGRFDIKVKMSFDKPVTHNIWMIGEKSAPQINVMNFGASKKRFSVGLSTKEGTKSFNVNGADFTNGYYILSLVWTADKLVWFVNGVEVASIKGGVPQEQMYLIFSSNITDSGDTAKSKMSVDWIRCYEML
jgi:hypothetical protein